MRLAAEPISGVGFFRWGLSFAGLTSYFDSVKGRLYVCRTAGLFLLINGEVCILPGNDHGAGIKHERVGHPPT